MRVSNGYQIATEPSGPIASARLRKFKCAAKPSAQSASAQPTPSRSAAEPSAPRTSARLARPQWHGTHRCGAHPRVAHGLTVPRNPRRRAHCRVSQGLTLFHHATKTWRRAHPRVPHGLKVPRNPRRRAHPRVSHGLQVPRNPRRRTHSQISQGARRDPKPSAPSASHEVSPRDETLGAERICETRRGSTCNETIGAEQSGRGNPSNRIASDFLASMATEFQVLGNVGAIKRHATMQE